MPVYQGESFSQFLFDAAPPNTWLVFRLCNHDCVFESNHTSIIDAREWIKCLLMEKKYEHSSFRIYVEEGKARRLFQGACHDPFRTFTFVEGVNAKYNHSKHDGAPPWCIKGDKIPFLFCHTLDSDHMCSS
jgi:hypothetical protein